MTWPNGGRIALTVTVMLDYWELEPPENASRDPRIVSPLGNFKPDFLTWSQREYGARVGIFRLLAALDRHGLTPSVALGTAAARRYPELVDECARRNAIFLGHGDYATRRITSRMSETEERDFIVAARDELQRVTGQRPRGWCGQDFNESTRTVALLAEAGFDYTTDWSNDDRPYLLQGGLLALPAQAEWNDLECMWLRRVPPAIWADGLVEAFTVLQGEGGAVFNLALHPWITGQAHRIRYLEAALSQMLERGGVWAATTDMVAAAARPQL